MRESTKNKRRQQILDAALLVSEREGLEGLTIRRLCDELGLSPPVVYRYVKDKEDIIDGLVRRVIEAQPAVPPPGQSTRDWLFDLLVHMRAQWLAHPGLMVMMTSSEPLKASALESAESVLSALCKTGLTDREAAGAFHVLMSYLLGSVVLARGSATAAITTDLPNLPLLARLGRDLDARRHAVFKSGLDALLRALLPSEGASRG